MTLFHERREPIFDDDARRLPPSAPGTSPGLGVENRPAGPDPGSARPEPQAPVPRRIGQGTWPWLGLAAAAVVLATPVLGSVRLPGVQPGPALAEQSPDAGAAGDEIVPGAFSLRLAGASSSDDLWRRWADLRQRRLGLFDDVPASVRPVAGGGAGFMLVVGEYRNAAAAAQACGTLRAHALDCEVMRADGAPLKPQA